MEIDDIGWSLGREGRVCWLGGSTLNSAPVFVVEGVPSARWTEAVGGIVEYVRYRGVTPAGVEALFASRD